MFNCVEHRLCSGTRPGTTSSCSYSSFFWKHNSRPDLTSNWHAQVKLIGRQWNTTWYNLLLFCSCSSFFWKHNSRSDLTSHWHSEVKLIVRWWYDLFYHFNKMGLHLTGPAVEQPILPLLTILVNLHSLCALYIYLPTHLFTLILKFFCINYLEQDSYLFIMLQFSIHKIASKVLLLKLLKGLFLFLSIFPKNVNPCLYYSK
jgi:hypothetical protein